jgi:hypothetical protein
MPIEVFGDNPSAILTSVTDAPAAGTVETTWAVTSSTLPVCTATGTLPTQCHIADKAAPSEVILVTANAGGNATMTVTRGAEGTTPVVHAAGATLVQIVSDSWLTAMSTPGLYQPAFLAGVR